MRLRVRPHTFQAAPSHSWASVEKCYWSRASGCSPAPLCLFQLCFMLCLRILAAMRASVFTRVWKCLLLKSSVDTETHWLCSMLSNLFAQVFSWDSVCQFMMRKSPGFPPSCLPPLGRAILRMQISDHSERSSVASVLEFCSLVILVHDIMSRSH